MSPSTHECLSFNPSCSTTPPHTTTHHPQALADCPALTDLVAGSFNLSRTHARLSSLRRLQFGGVFASKGLDRLFPLPALEALSVQGIDSVTGERQKRGRGWGLRVRLG